MQKRSRSKRPLPGQTSSLPVAMFESLEGRTLLSHSWFVSIGGSNANPGTLAAPFRTIQYAADHAVAGDTVLVRGGVYHETVTVHNSGTYSAPIVFNAYNGESVTIDGADPLTGWTTTDGTVWNAPMSTNLGVGRNQVFVDGQMMNEARWPNTPLILTPGQGFDLTNPVLATATSAVASATSATLNDPSLTQPVGFWDGATLRIAAGQGWANQTGVVTDSGPGYITFSYTLHDPIDMVPSAGNHYYLYGVAGALDSAGEWFRSPSGQLSLRTPAGDSPAQHVVEAKTRQYGFDLSKAAYIHINDFHLFGCSINTTSASVSDVINHITAQYLSQFATSVDGFIPPIKSGIILAGNNDVLQNSVIADSAGDGVYVSGAYVRVNNNIIHDTDYAGVDCALIRVGGYRDNIFRNTGYNTGRDGILFSGNQDSITSNNIYRYGLQTSDLGGFYAAGYNGKGTVIAYNKFHDAPNSGYGSTGIMLDNSAGGFIIHHNITWNVFSGLRMNSNPFNVQVYNNTFDATNWAMDKDSVQTDDWSTVLLENNIMTHPIMFGLNVQLINNISNHHQFVDAANGNFSLLAGAPAIDTGLLIPPYTNGYVGAAPDIGALEYGVTPFATGVSAVWLPVDPTGG